LFKTKNAGAWLREDGADGPSVVHATEVLNQGLDLQGVTVFQYDREHGLTERIEAKRAVLKDGRWELDDAWVSAVGQERAFYKRYLLSTYLTPTQVRDSLGTVFAISFWDLPNFIQIAEKAGLPATQYRVQYQLLLSRPFLLVTMVLIAATCSLRGFRFGNVQINAVFGLAAGFTFFVFAEVSRNFAMAGLTSAVAAAWVPVIVAASLALTVLLYKEDG
jgi:lipopolysaccharide export system permease protein